MDALNTLLARCKCGVYLTVNEHRDYYDTPAQRLEELDSREAPPNISDEVRAGILASGNIVELQFYPDTPVGFYVIVHHDLDEALRLALDCIGAAERRGEAVTTAARHDRSAPRQPAVGTRLDRSVGRL